MSQLNVIPKESKKIFCFLGSTIGNLSMEKAQRFLMNLSEIMHSGDLLLLGFDMVKNKDILEKAYNDRKKVTEKFNKNILDVVNSHIGTNFDSNNFEHTQEHFYCLPTLEDSWQPRMNTTSSRCVQ